MTPEARLQSEVHLQKLAQGLSVSNELQNENVFSPSMFLEAARPIEEERPLVSYQIVDTEADTEIGYVAYETLRDEPLYQQKNKDGFRYKIMGMKIVDHGSGFDSQLSALYLSSKTGKRHLRGKFGEGAKMSELHLLRNGASMKMRSRYTVKSGDSAEQSRVWQTRPQVKDDRLVSRGVEVEQESSEDTGSMVSISLREADDGFRKDFIENADPRLEGLEKNIAGYSSQGFSYPMPITEKHLSGVDTSGDGDIQYVQGIRVELAKESFGYQKPWFSYNFLDSSIIGGRDRNEIKGEITNRIYSFWQHIDSPALLEQLVRIAVHDASKDTGSIFSSSESSVLREILTADREILIAKTSPKSFPTENVQKIVDDALLHELELEENVLTLVISSRDRKDKNLADVISYAKEQGYQIKTMAVDIGTSALEGFAKRLSDRYEIVTWVDIRNEMQGAPKEDEEEIVEGEREKAIREVFLPAVESVNKLVLAAGIEPKTFELEFDIPKKVNVGRERPDWEDNDDEDDYSNSIFQMHSRVDLPPITLTWTGDKDYLVQINPDRISYLGHSDPRVLQREIEIYLLGSFTEYSDGGRDRESVLKRSQQFLDTIIEKLIPEDAPILEAIPKQLEYEKDPAVLLRLTKSILGEIETKHEKEKMVYEITPIKSDRTENGL